MAPSDPVFHETDLNGAVETLNRVFLDQDWEQGEAKFQQNTLVQLLRTRDVPRTLALATINDLIARGVLQEGKSFWDLNIFVRFDGKQTDEVNLV
jgi:hypothetical protein